MQRTRVNFMIRITPIRVIGPENEQIGVIETNDAIKMAQEQGLDLVEISPDARPPVCKIMDYGKFKYEQGQKDRKNRAASKATELKEIRLGRSVKIDPHDIMVRVQQARRFLVAGHKVLFTQRLKGREVAHKSLGMDNLKRVLEALQDIAKVEQPPRDVGRAWTMMLAPDKPKVEAYKRSLDKERAEKLARGEKVEEEKTIEQLDAELQAQNAADHDED
ncbi:MAG: translation initiation factor IF-3 [Phycisphaerales bacterium]|nr:MAG: translation initiation factor IF-3 [Phycisphaerales bacterium]